MTSNTPGQGLLFPLKEAKNFAVAGGIPALPATSNYVYKCLQTSALDGDENCSRSRADMYFFREGVCGQVVGDVHDDHLYFRI